MSNQLLIYKRAVPVNPEQHKDLSVKTGQDYAFAKDVNSVPLTAAEFPAASAEYSIVFAGSEENIVPVCVLGLRDKENLYVDTDNSWNAKYVPAFVRRYPFVFSHRAEDDRFLLCIDEQFAGNNTDGLGERLFDSEGTQTQYTKSVLSFMQNFQIQSERTRQFCQKLKELELFEPVQARVTLESGEQASLKGFMVINRKKLNALPGDTLSEMAQKGELEMSYIHLHSLQNLAKLGALVKDDQAEVEETPAITEPNSADTTEAPESVQTH